MRTAKITLVVTFCVFAGLKVKLDEAARAADKPLLTIRAFAIDPGGALARTRDFAIVIERGSGEAGRQLADSHVTGTNNQ